MLREGRLRWIKSYIARNASFFDPYAHSDAQVAAGLAEWCCVEMSHGWRVPALRLSPRQRIQQWAKSL